MCGHDIQQSTNQLRKVANPVYGQLNRGKFPCPRSRLRIWFRETGLAVPSLVSLLILYTNAESGAWYSSRIPGRRPYIFTSTTHPRVYRVTQLRTDGIHCRESVGTGPVVLSQGSSSNGCCPCITMDQMLLCSSLFPHPLLIYIENVPIIGCTKYTSIKYYCCSQLLYCLWNCFFIFTPDL